MKKIFILLLFFYPIMGIAQIYTQTGDIVVFNAPLQIEKIRVQLFYCSSKQIFCTNWKPLTMASPVISPGEYYIFKLNDQAKTYLAGREINAKVYSVNDKKWSDQLTFIGKYSDHEYPFYQFICWARKEVAPHFACSNTDSLAQQKGSYHKYLSLVRSALNLIRL